MPCQKLQQVFQFSLSALTQAHKRFATRLLLVSPEIRCSGVSSRYCFYGNHAAGSKPVSRQLLAGIGSWFYANLKTFSSHQLRIE